MKVSNAEYAVQDYLFLSWLFLKLHTYVHLHYPLVIDNSYGFDVKRVALVLTGLLKVIGAPFKGTHSILIPRCD